MLPPTTILLIALVGLFVLMFIIVPPTVGPRISHIGFWFGLIMAFLILWLGQAYLGLFRINGDYTLLGTPIILSLIWIPPVIMFSYYFLTVADTKPKRILLILAFALLTTAAQYILDLLGIWESLNWNIFYTFSLAVTTHIIISSYLILKRKNLILNP